MYRIDEKDDGGRSVKYNREFSGGNPDCYLQHQDVSVSVITIHTPWWAMQIAVQSTSVNNY